MKDHRFIVAVFSQDGFSEMLGGFQLTEAAAVQHCLQVQKNFTGNRENTRVKYAAVFKDTYIPGVMHAAKRELVFSVVFGRWSEPYKIADHEDRSYYTEGGLKWTK